MRRGCGAGDTAGGVTSMLVISVDGEFEEDFAGGVVSHREGLQCCSSVGSLTVTIEALDS